MTDAPPVLSGSVPYRDRSGWLIFFGIVQVLLGVLSILMALFMLMAPRLSHAGEGDPPMTAFVVGIYGGAAVLLIWLGAGSIRARRWGRILSLLVAWNWLIFGILGLVAASFTMPAAFAAGAAQANLPPEQAAAAHVGMFIGVAVMLGMMAVFFIALPGVMIWFFGGKNVQATCEARNPQRSWTDACPFLVLWLSLWQASAAATMLLMGLTNHWVLPLFGFLITGWAAAIALAALAGLYGWCAWMLYRLRPAGWWVTLIVMALFTSSAIINSFALDMDKMYRLMGYSEITIQRMQTFALSPGAMMIGGALVGFLPFLILLLASRKHFRAPTLATA